MVFAQDSVVQDTTKLQMGAKAKKIQIFEKGGKHLLTLTSNADSIPTIENVRVFDARYVSDKGIGLNSTFQDIQKGYGIKKIVTTLNSIVVFPKGSNLYFTIDKAELPDNLRYATNSIEAVLDLVKAGAGISALARYLAAPELQSGELVSLLPDHRIEAIPCHLCYYHRSHIPRRVRLLIDFLVNRFQERTSP